MQNQQSPWDHNSEYMAKTNDIIAITGWPSIVCRASLSLQLGNLKFKPYAMISVYIKSGGPVHISVGTSSFSLGQDTKSCLSNKPEVVGSIITLTEM